MNGHNILSVDILNIFYWDLKRNFLTIDMKVCVICWYWEEKNGRYYRKQNNIPTYIIKRGRKRVNEWKNKSSIGTFRWKKKVKKETKRAILFKRHANILFVRPSCVFLWRYNKFPYLSCCCTGKIPISRLKENRILFYCCHLLLPPPSTTRHSQVQLTTLFCLSRLL